MLEGIGSALRLARTAPASRIYGELVSICGMTELGSVRVLFTDNARMVKPSTRVSLAVGVGPTMALPGALAQVDVPWLSVVGRDTLPRYALASCIATGDAAFDARFAVSVASGTSALTGVSFLQSSFHLSPELRQAMSTMVPGTFFTFDGVLATSTWDGWSVDEGRVRSALWLASIFGREVGSFWSQLRAAGVQS